MNEEKVNRELQNAVIQDELRMIRKSKSRGSQSENSQEGGDDTRRPSTIGPITRGMIKKLQDEYSPKGQTLFAIFGWKIGDLEDAFKMPKHGEGLLENPSHFAHVGKVALDPYFVDLLTPHTLHCMELRPPEIVYHSLKQTSISPHHNHFNPLHTFHSVQPKQRAFSAITDPALHQAFLDSSIDSSVVAELVASSSLTDLLLCILLDASSG
ncbi:hypothetical protein LR48_Vigan07g160400 [Vigna angularis]|uniref:Uncharacterized protein n=1 Tax=Phaseolus angularis TaxID=3914 RepID=A0A0L9UYG6_PHAAN|nr:hypothetical protein LR48_Vigan07g160400 [Vigna angularis]